MKKIFVSIFALCCLSFAQQALAADASLCMAACTVAINVNSGHSSTYCQDDSGCECTPVGQACQHASAIAATSQCSSYGMSDAGDTATGLHCCVSGCYRSPDQTAANTEIQSAVSDDSLQNVFDGSRTTVFFAYVDSVLRSPNAGRTLIRDAKVDACIGWANFNALLSNSDPYSAWSDCTGSNYCGSTKNAYCTANSNQVCIDRCNCKYQSTLVGLGYPDPGCSNL